MKVVKKILMGLMLIFTVLSSAACEAKSNSKGKKMEILYAFLIVGGIGLVLGIALALFAKLFYVKEDSRISDVEKMLPNYNCGSCGYPGCHQMAENLVSGKEKNISKCKPGKKDKNFDPIIEYLSNHPDDDGTLHVPTLK